MGEQLQREGGRGGGGGEIVKLCWGLLSICNRVCMCVCTKRSLFISQQTWACPSPPPPPPIPFLSHSLFSLKGEICSWIQFARQGKKKSHTKKDGWERSKRKGLDYIFIFRLWTPGSTQRVSAPSQNTASSSSRDFAVYSSIHHHSSFVECL